MSTYLFHKVFDGRSTRLGRIIGRTLYKGKICHQIVNFEISLLPVLYSFDFERIIEIGTADGGFTFFLHDTFPDKIIDTYDIVPSKERNTMFLHNLPNVRPYVINVFDENYNIIDNNLLEVLHNTKKLLIMCDGGNKTEEVKAFAKHLKVDDYLMWHDYAEQDVLERLKNCEIWRGCEVNKEDIEPVLVNHGFEFIHPELQYTAWGCARKVR